MAESSEIRKMEDALKKAETSFHVLFEKMNGDGSARVVCDCNYKDLLEALRILFRIPLQLENIPPMCGRRAVRCADADQPCNPFFARNAESRGGL